MGRVTYYEPVVWLTKRLANGFRKIGLFTKEQVDILKAIRQAPYIRSWTITGNYRFTDNLELRATGFWGMDGIGFTYEIKSQESSVLLNSSRTKLDWTNYQGFITGALIWNPRNDMLVKFSLGTGYEDAVVDADSKYFIKRTDFTEDFRLKYPELSGFHLSPYDRKESIRESDLLFNVQTRADYDWELGKGFLVAAGMQEMFTRYGMKGGQQGFYEVRFTSLGEDDRRIISSMLGPLSGQLRDDLRIAFPVTYSPNAANFLFTTSGYGLFEYVTPDKRFNAEFGLRVDHYYLLGRDFSYGTKPVLNPRLNADYNVFKNKWIIESLDISSGTGFFSTVDNTVFRAEKKNNVSVIKPNRSWTSVLGTKITFSEGMTLNIEGYFKYIFDRMYVPVTFNLDSTPDIRPQFNGKGKVWGIDMMLQKTQSRYWDGWITYSFSWAKYRDPLSGDANIVVSGSARGNEWYFPSFHRFHNLNLVVNYKPSPQFNIYTRFGLASGTQLSRRTTDRPTTYPVLMYNGSGIVQKYEWPSVRDENNRTTPSLSMDIKFSYFGKKQTGKTRYEIYFAVENLLSLVYMSKGNPGYNPYTGEIDTDINSAGYGMPIPVPSFGFKVSY